MGMTIVWILLAALAVLAAVVIFRTMKFVPPVEEPGVEDPIDLDHDKIVQDMVDMIRCKTVSYYEEEKMDMEEFRKFQKLLEERFPLDTSFKVALLLVVHLGNPPTLHPRQQRQRGYHHEGDHPKIVSIHRLSAFIYTKVGKNRPPATDLTLLNKT